MKKLDIPAAYHPRLPKPAPEPGRLFVALPMNSFPDFGGVVAER